MKVFGVLFFLVMVVSLSSRAETILSFKDWKAEKIQQIQSRINSEKFQIEALKLKKQSETSLSAARSSGVSLLLQRYEKQLTQEQWNLEVAQDLSITEYIMLYVGAQPSKTRFQQAAIKLAPQDVAELIEAYSASLGVQTPAENIVALQPANMNAIPGKTNLGAASPTASNQRK